ncbi:hypothetical protein M422DRAFT_256679 [Sphaerobolus stellatus SS14]|uniref:Unplaced genomic scaffold SPHSTscaffold_69, whole genome shotgun sequence n=1 Tax=Sphaerobolus stellatus (strain SS14) TaxID=990650 RepID=A0A0C9VGA0_SPHS4|nr:hypothetical protein M422DRAFT_256679 [Sphaerobolus stellatus SS14]
MDQGSGSWQNLGDAPSEPDHISPDGGDMDEEESFTIPAKEVNILHQEYTEFINLKDNTEIVLSEAMEATERLNTVFNRIRTSMNRMSPRMKELFIVPVTKSSGKTREPGYNWAHDKEAAKAATEQIMVQTAIVVPVPGTGTDDRMRLTKSHVPHDGDRHSLPPRQQNIQENIPHAAKSEQSDDSQLRCGHDAHTGYVQTTRDEHVMTQSRMHHAHDIHVTEDTRVNSQESMHRRRNLSPINTQHEPVSVNNRDRYNLSADPTIQGVPESIEHSRCSIRQPQSIDMNALREEIKEMISATIKEKLRSDAVSVTSVSQSILALDGNAQYWSDLSNNATRRSHRALELQLKLAEEKVNTLLHKEAPEEALLEAAQEVRTIHFQLDQNMCLREAGLMPEQQVRFSADTGRNITSPSRNYGLNPINEVCIPWPEADAPFARQSPPALSISAQLDGAVVNMTSEYSGIQQMVRQAIQNASHEEEPEKSFLAKASVKMGNPPTYSSEHNLEKFENWVASVLRYMSMYNLLGPQAGKVQLQFLGQCLTDEAQEWFYQQKWFMPTLLLNKFAVNYDSIMQGSMIMQQLHQELTKLAKQMIELPDVYSYRRRFMNTLKPDIREQVLKKGFTPEFSKINELVEEAVTLDNAKHYTLGYNSNHGSAYLNKTATAEYSRALHTTTQNKSSSNPKAGSSNQHKSGNNTFQSHSTTQLLSTGGGNDRRVAGARIEEVILEEDEGQIEEFDEYEDQPEEDDQQYHFDDEEYEMRSIDNEVVHVNAVIKASGYNDHCRLYGIRVQEAETDLRVSAVLQTGGKEQPVYDHCARKRARLLPTRGKENETIFVFWDRAGTKAHCLLDSGCEGIMISSDFVRANKLPKFELEKPVILQLACVGSKSTVQYGLTAKILLSKEKYDEYFDITNVNYDNIILGTPFLHGFEIPLDFKNNCVQMGKLSFPNRFGSITPTEADEDETCLQKEKPKALPTPTLK